MQPRQPSPLQEQMSAWRAGDGRWIVVGAATKEEGSECFFRWKWGGTLWKVVQSGGTEWNGNGLGAVWEAEELIAP